MSKIHEEVTGKMIEMLEQGIVPWRKPWESDVGYQMPVNTTTGNQYHGINVALLWMAAEEKGYKSDEWATLKQFNKVGKSVAPHEKGTMIVKYDTFNKKRPDEDEFDVIPYLKSYYVFNVAQLKGYDPEKEQKIVKPLVERLHNVEDFIANTGAEIHEDGGNKAFYNIHTDSIHLPARSAFTGSNTQTPQEAFYSTELHELTHWTGHETRCNRNFKERYDVGWYVREEIVAEMGSAFLCAELNITDGPQPENANYIGSWLEVFKEDSKTILTVAGCASKATEYLWSLQGNKNGHSTPVR